MRKSLFLIFLTFTILLTACQRTELFATPENEYIVLDLKDELAILKNGKPVYAIGSPGGSTIITTVLQTLVNRIDLGMTLPQAVAAPRASSRNTSTVTAEPEYIDDGLARQATAVVQALNLPAGKAPRAS